MRVRLDLLMLSVLSAWGLACGDDPSITRLYDNYCCYLDNDGDGVVGDDLYILYPDHSYSSPTKEEISLCEEVQSGGWVDNDDNYEECPAELDWLPATAEPGEDCDDENQDVKGPRSWYPDNDWDGQGDQNAEATVSCDSPGSWWVEGPATDCNDNANQVYASSDKDFPYYAAPDASGSFDYNCDGVEEPEFGCAVYDDPSYITKEGFDCKTDDTGTDAQPPACGETGRLYECEGQATNCSEPEIHTTHVQLCR